MIGRVDLHYYTAVSYLISTLFTTSHHIEILQKVMSLHITTNGYLVL